MSVRKENFRRIAEKRTNRIISMIETLGNLSNKSYYDYTEKEIELIFSAIETALEEERKKFKTNTKQKKFKLFTLQKRNKESNK
jgi:hypothetical protein